MQGGVSKSTRGLHVSEDVMAGLNHTLRGGSVAYMEAVSCGKGRDTGFDSVLVFEAKVSAGNGEVCDAGSGKLGIITGREGSRVCFTCGKGQDTGFDSVLVFEAKVSAGNEEVSRV